MGFYKIEGVNCEEQGKVELIAVDDLQIGKHEN